MNKEHPLVSVVIPVYNVEEYLRECVDSVLRQTYPYFEVVLIDDGSTDSSGSICDDYAARDSRIRVIHQENHGLGHARNTGMDTAAGKYIIFLDSDDYWEHDLLEKVLREAETHSLQAVVFTARSFCDGVEHKGLPYRQTCQNGIVKTGTESLACASEHKEYYSQACLRFYRLDYLRENGFRFDEEIIHEDESFSFLAYVHADRIECLGERLYVRRYRPGSIMLNLDLAESIHGYRTAIDTLLRFMRERPLSPAEKELYRLKIMEYIRNIHVRYIRAKNREKRNAAYLKKIVYDAQETIRRACRKENGLPLGYRLLHRRFSVGVRVTEADRKMQRIIRHRRRFFAHAG